MNFPFFQIKIIIIQIWEEIYLMWKKFRILNWFLVSASRIRIRFLKFWFAGSGSGRICTGSATLPRRHPLERQLHNTVLLHFQSNYFCKDELEFACSSSRDSVQLKVWKNICRLLRSDPCYLPLDITFLKGLSQQSFLCLVLPMWNGQGLT